jgi:hypothetical protein
MPVGRRLTYVSRAQTTSSRGGAMRLDRTLRTVVMLAAFGGFAATPGWGGGNTFESELGSDPAKVLDDVKLSMMNGNGDGSDSGRGPVPYFKALKAPPKRVALISFYVWDCGNKKESSYNIYGGSYTYHVSSTRTRNVAAGAVDLLATELHDAGIGALKDAFATAGMQLLTPDEFADTDAKRAAYTDFTPDVSGFEKFFKALQSMDVDNFRFTGVPDGYRLFPLTNVQDVKGNHFQLATTGVGVGKMAESAGHDFAEKLGVDAVVILYNVVQAQKNAIRMRGTYMYMFGPNPVPDTGKSLYWRGHQYSGVALRMDVPFITTDKKGQLVDADYKGYAIVAGAVGTKMAEHLKEKTQGAK